MNNLPKYVEKDLKVLYNAEFKVSKYGFSYTDNVKMAQKLFKIAQRLQRWDYAQCRILLFRSYE